MTDRREGSVAPWTPQLLSHIQQTQQAGQSVEFGLATTSLHGPRVRLLDHRGFVGDQHMPVFVTGASSHKAADIEASRTPKGSPVEMLYWFKELQVQWRIRGWCWLLAEDLGREQKHVVGELDWRREYSAIVGTLDAEKRAAFEAAGLRIGIIVPEAAEIRELSERKKQMWAVASEKWEEVQAWP